MHYYFYDKRRQFVSLTFAPEQFVSDAKHVLVWAFAQERGKEIMMTRHRKRGWEIPGGKVEPGEKPEEAAHRELFEETGAKIVGLKWIGQYVIEPVDPADQFIVKNIYSGIITKQEQMPAGFETLESRLFPLAVQPFAPGFSPFMQDNIFPLCRAYIQR